TKRLLETRWTELVYDGLWFSRARTAIDAFVDATQEVVTGEVRLSLRPSAAVVVGRRSELALYAETLASYASGETFPHEAAEGTSGSARSKRSSSPRSHAGGPRYDA